MAAKTPPTLSLPLAIVSPTDVQRLSRELEGLDNNVHQAGLRAGGQAATKPPLLSRLLDEFVTTNQLDVTSAADRKRAADFLQQLGKQAPVLHLSFAADPSAAFTQKIVEWLRHNIHEHALMQIGLQPTLAAGFTLRTASHYYDFSLRAHFARQRPLLVAKLHEAGGVGER